MKKKFTFLGMLAIFMSIAFYGNSQTFFSEDFENGGTFPAGWTLSPGTGNDWVIDDGTDNGPGFAHSGTYTAMFDDYSYSTGTVAEMITPAIDLSSTSPGDSIVLSYWYWDGDGSDQVEVLISTDGTNYTPIDTTDATVDPWAQQFVDLSAYAGQSTIYISFKGTSVYGYSNPNVDDVLVRKLLSDDLTASDVIVPTPYCGITLDTIKMSIVNVGTSAQSSYSATYSIDGGATWITPENITTTLNPEDTLIYTFATLADFSTPGTYDVLAAVNLASDGDNSNDTSLVKQFVNGLVNTLSYTENFDVNPDGVHGVFANSWESDFDAVDTYTFGWRTETTSTASSSTGPSGPSSGTGTYIYLETSGGSAGDIAALTGPCLDLSSITNSIILSYKYHMYGSSMGNLYTDVMIGGLWQCIDTIQGQQQTAEADPWLTNVLLLTNNVEKIRFRGEKGSSYTGDMAIDDILIKEVLANDLAALNTTVPTAYCGITLDTIKMSIVNVGTSAQSSYSATYSIDGGATWITPENITITLNPGDTLNYTFTMLADFSIPGTYDILAAVILAGDGDGNNDTITGGSLNSTPVISSFPYTQDFEGTQYWNAGGINSSWQLGTPAAPVINSAASGSNAWTTNLTGDYNASENSYVESPCFDFSTLHNPLVQFNYWAESEGDGSWNYDGAVIEYSIDDGTTWNIIGSIGDWINWYDMPSISALSADGWGGDIGDGAGTNGWVEAKHLLSQLAGQSSVKFRIHFASDGGVQYDGFAFDDFVIREGEINLAVTEINYNGPEGGTDTTEFIEWYNAGNDAVNIDGFYYTQGVEDTLPNLLVLPGEYFVSAYDSTVMADFFGYTDAITWDNGGLSNGGEDIALHTSWGALVDSLAYDDANGWPTEPDGNGPTLVFCEHNIGLDQNDPANWTISSVYVDSLNLLPVFASPGADDNACQFVDVAVVNPPSGDWYDCDMTATDTVNIAITNLGNDIINAVDTIYAFYQIDANPVVADTIFISTDMLPNDTVQFNFAQTADFSAIATYNWKVWVSYSADANQINDTTTGTITHYIPVVDLGADTIYTLQPDTIVLDAGAGYDVYTWSDGSTNQTFNVSTFGQYYVDAVDTNGCSASDTVWVMAAPALGYDVAVIDPANGSAFSDCDLGVDTIEITIKNTGTATISAVDTIYAYYQIDGGAIVADTIFVTSDFVSGDSLDFIFNQPYDFSALQTYNWKIWINYPQDTIATNDTVIGTLTHYEPVVDLGPDTLCTTQPDTIVLDAGAGFDTYTWSDGSINQTFNVIVYGTYYVEAFDSNGCSASDTIIIYNCVNVNENTNLAFNLYPNPNNGTFTVELPEYTKDVRIEILNIQGDVIYSDVLVANRNNINISDYAKGIYFVKLISDKTERVEKIIIQ